MLAAIHLLTTTSWSPCPKVGCAKNSAIIKQKAVARVIIPSSNIELGFH
jgi:hypothetical protein